MADQFPHTHDQYIDPHATLSNADVVRFLMEDTSSKIAELWKDVRNELDLDRKHNQEINKRIVEGLGKRIDNLDQYLIKSLNHESMTTLPVSTSDQTKLPSPAISVPRVFLNCHHWMSILRPLIHPCFARNVGKPYEVNLI